MNLLVFRFRLFPWMVLTGILAGCRRGELPPAVPPKIAVRVVTAEAFDTGKTRASSDYLATLRGDVETELSFKLGGGLQSIGRSGESRDWQEGARFIKGEVLASLKEEDFVSTLKSARAQAQVDAQTLARQQKLRVSGAVSQQELEAAVASKLASEALQTKAEQALRDVVLLAPYDGTIAARLVSSGETVPAGKTVLKVADLRQMSVELGIPDHLIGRVQVGKELPVKVSTLEAAAFIGRVTEVGVAAKEGAKLFRVVIKVPNPEGVLKSGMTASVSLSETKTPVPGSVLIPLSALVSASHSGGTSNQLAVFVVDPQGRAHERAVLTDDFIRSSIIVTQGLKAGERVVTAGASTLYEGAEVDARPAENP